MNNMVLTSLGPPLDSVKHSKFHENNGHDIYAPGTLNHFIAKACERKSH